MISKTTSVKVRYNETDQMGIVNNAMYATYFEIGRIELFRDLGVDYKDIEQQGVLMPVSELFVKYFKPAFYDDILQIETSIMQLPSARMRFDSKIYKSDGTLINQGHSIVAFIDANSRQPMRAPKFIVDLLSEYFKA